ncbi:SDR family oxidoreductase [Nocardioides sp. OK12]|uniref:SDR family oxidoreductase n=1 Tax=Nocardioides sp. OK12 TaxID=2758661 RepID=UPI0021C3F954|nr:SDR family oxidoreductase [Nocardioides sp. OK12]
MARIPAPHLPAVRDRVVVVTGGARGIGLATAGRFAAAGALVLLGDLDVEAARDAARTVGAATGAPDRVRGVHLDVTDRASFAALVDEAQAWGPVEVLVNNAGIMPLGPVLEQPDAVIDKALGVNLRAVVTGTRLVAPGMVERRRGHVVNIASAVGRLGLAGGAVYSASKFGVLGFSEAAMGELAPHGVHVSCVLPTVVATELSAGVAATRGMRPCTPEQVADTVLDVVRRPRFETWVPGYAKGLFHTSNALPRRVRRLVSHALHADSSLSDVDQGARAGYEQRAQR